MAGTVNARKSAIFATAAVLAAVVLFVTGPPAPQPTSFAVPSAPTTLIRRGAFHVHTTRSDGALDKRQVAAAAARAGLSFVIFTDHGDATRVPDPPEIIDGVLCLDAAEISTNGGHYIALGMSASPYPLGGEADTVVEDVARLGGFGIVAHPGSARAELAWTEWSAPVDGLEWLNADSEWRDESRLRLSRSFLDYLSRPAGALASLLDRPVGALAKWDQLTTVRPVVGLAGQDAHGGIGAETGTAGGRRWHIPSYESSFRSFSLYVTVPQENERADARVQADALVAAIRRGATFTAIDAVAAPAALDFKADADGTIVSPGGSLPLSASPAMFRVHAAMPPGGRIVLLRNGREVANGSGGALEHADALPGAYRVEVHAARAPGEPPVPWLVSNPIYRLPPRPAPTAAPNLISALEVPLSPPAWRVEHSEGSSGTIHHHSDGVDFAYRLRPGAHVSQFVALVSDLSQVPDLADTIAVRARSTQPLRVSVQLRFAKDGNARWGRSIYLDGADRDIRIELSRMQPAESGTGRPALSRATSLLFVIDLVNAAPGAAAGLTLTQVRFAKAETQ